MYIRSEQLFSQVVPKNRFYAILQFPLFRMMIVILFLIPVVVLSNLFMVHVVEKTSGNLGTILGYARDLLSFISMLLMYRLFTRVIEKRAPYEISGNRMLREFGSGTLISIGIVGSMVLLLVVLGYYRIDHFNPATNLIDRFFQFGIGSFIEELAIRMILFKLIEEWCGSWISMVLTGILFGFAHIFNPNATVWTSLGLVVSDTILFAGAYMLTRRLWMVWGIHMSWNWFQTAVFGMPNSGKTFAGWITPEISGPDWITGGAFGIEASYIQIVLSFFIGIIVLQKALNRGQRVLPQWTRNKILKSDAHK